ncbi:FabG-like short-chain dehydrogenase/reductase [Secundilactobacillus pentosiphilus]|uniref:FabG-like short-chain dehydrogenase/reductase n=1 Tax=Secundilactobacillus pentosiphilus TaxID=1714682 RepID=A0A1Z5IW63_9LACO|nr:hypothetical protein [Secundilactobacillus pentosiphilus]GAX05842.1 FabG-like short-chain dehydrogenase/reductase [Secundilactobacillus pentosiphilus]
MNDRLKNKVAIITGSSGGLEIIISEYYVCEKVIIVLTYLNESDTEKAIVADSSSAIFLKQDGTKGDHLTIDN